MFYTHVFPHVEYWMSLKWEWFHQSVYNSGSLFPINSFQIIWNPPRRLNSNAQWSVIRYHFVFWWKFIEDEFCYSNENDLHFPEGISRRHWRQQWIHFRMCGDMIRMKWDYYNSKKMPNIEWCMVAELRYAGCYSTNYFRIPYHVPSPPWRGFHTPLLLIRFISFPTHSASTMEE